MAKVITFSRVFPKYHINAGKPTYFVEKFLKSVNKDKIQTKLIIQDSLILIDFKIFMLVNPKHHTIRAGKRFKKGDFFSPRVWSGKPYRSKQIILFEDTEILKVWDFEIVAHNDFFVDLKIDNQIIGMKTESILAQNDGLSWEELIDWFKNEDFKGQIICWNENVDYPIRS